MSRTVQGERRFLNDGEDWHMLEAGEYAVSPSSGEWYAAAPIIRPVWPYHLVANLSRHKVVENEDGTITVEPSILIKTHENDCEVFWHGYLRKGVWEELETGRRSNTP